MEPNANGDVSTPEAMRAASQGERPSLPGRSPSPTKASSTTKPSTNPPSKLRRCGHTLSFVPWWALLVLGLLVAGVVLVAIKGPAAAAAADDLMAQVQSDTSTGFPQYMSVYSGSMWATVGMGGAVCAFLVLGAWVHLDQRLRRAGKYAQAKGSYGPMTFKFCSLLGWLGVVLVALLALWMALVAVMLACWTVQCWNLEQGAVVASANIAALDAATASQDKSLQDLGKAVMVAAGGSAAVTFDAARKANAPAPAASVPAPAAGPSAGEVSATDLTTGADGTALGKIDAAFSAYAASFDLLAANLSQVAAPSTVTHNGGLCPSVACLNMALYRFTESPLCVCTKDDVQAVAQLASDCKDTAQWALYGVACLCVGAIFGAMELSADVVLLGANQLFLRVIKRKSSRSSSRGSARKGDEAGVSKQMMSPSMPGRSGSYPFLTINAAAHT
ncbi:hypothetical protein ACK3TF_004355 [Chlorella vulgaris]